MFTDEEYFVFRDDRFADFGVIISRTTYYYYYYRIVWGLDVIIIL